MPGVCCLYEIYFARGSGSAVYHLPTQRDSVLIKFNNVSGFCVDKQLMNRIHI